MTDPKASSAIADHFPKFGRLNTPWYSLCEKIGDCRTRAGTNRRLGQMRLMSLASPINSSRTVMTSRCRRSSARDILANRPIPTPARTPARIVSILLDVRFPCTDIHLVKQRFCPIIVSLPLIRQGYAARTSVNNTTPRRLSSAPIALLIADCESPFLRGINIMENQAIIIDSDITHNAALSTAEGMVS